MVARHQNIAVQLDLIADSLTHIQEAVQFAIDEARRSREPLTTGRSPRAGKRRRVATSSDDSADQHPSALSIADRDGLTDSGKLFTITQLTFATITPPRHIAHGPAPKNLFA